MSHLVVEGLALGGLLICPLDDEIMPIYSEKTGRWGHKTKDGSYHVMCSSITGGEHDEGCPCDKGDSDER